MYPLPLPLAHQAYRIQDKARNVGFDWEEREQVWDKVKEEMESFKMKWLIWIRTRRKLNSVTSCLALFNAARLYKINPDNALELTNQKFIRRFNYLEEHTIKEGKSLKE
mgnify:CR=1 FL=1